MVSSTELNATFDLATQPTGVWTVIVTNLRDETISSPNSPATDFTVDPRLLPPTEPRVIQVVPASALVGTTLDVTILGSNFQNPATSAFGTDITVIDTAFIAPNMLRAKLVIASTAIPGPRNVTVTNSSGLSHTLLGGFTVTAPPLLISSIDDDEGEPGEQMNVIIRGSGFLPGATSEFGDGITVQATGFLTAQQLIAVLAINQEAEAGTRTVKVTNPDGQSVTFDGFTVIEEIDEPLSIKLVEILNGDDRPLDTVRTSGDRMQIGLSEEAQKIRVTFTAPVDKASVTAASTIEELGRASFLVDSDFSGEETGILFGSIRETGLANQVLFVLDPDEFSDFPLGTYQVTLFGTAIDKHEIITDPDGQPLDGDQDGFAGGNFSFTFVIAADENVRSQKKQ